MALMEDVRRKPQHPKNQVTNLRCKLKMTFKITLILENKYQIKRRFDNKLFNKIYEKKAT